MTDMFNQDVSIGDVVIFAGGNARYGGLKLMLGLVIGMTAKRIKILYGPAIADDKPFKTSNVTGKKLYVTLPNPVIGPQIQALKEAAK